ncbi:hypothetical protein LEP3755_64230 (plasmid) [Leptolyngbya sp. NIES-3755]|nr:hypothetical protein LEP3755_64230 [Leptolyngbya sp. NIES-3755]
MGIATPHKTLIIEKVSLGDLTSLIQLDEQGIAAYSWLNVQEISLTDVEQQQLGIVQSRLLNDPTHLLNECPKFGTCRVSENGDRSRNKKKIGKDI